MLITKNQNIIVKYDDYKNYSFDIKENSELKESHICYELVKKEEAKEETNLEIFEQENKTIIEEIIEQAEASAADGNYTLQLTYLWETHNNVERLNYIKIFTEKYGYKTLFKPYKFNINMKYNYFILTLDWSEPNMYIVSGGIIVHKSIIADAIINFYLQNLKYYDLNNTSDRAFFNEYLSTFGITHTEDHIDSETKEVITPENKLSKLFKAILVRLHSQYESNNDLQEEINKIKVYIQSLSNEDLHILYERIYNTKYFNEFKNLGIIYELPEPEIVGDATDPGPNISEYVEPIDELPGDSLAPHFEYTGDGSEFEDNNESNNDNNSSIQDTLNDSYVHLVIR